MIPLDTRSTGTEGSRLVIHVRAQGHLKHFRPDRAERFTVTLPGGATVRMLIDAAGIPWEEVGLVAVGGLQATDDHVLADSDEVTLLAPMEGG
jgi:molybdopterin converting factor small subunit